MPQLPNTRNELYAGHRARGMSPSKAAMAAGYASGSSTASQLEKDPAVVGRIEELLEELTLKRDSQRTAAIEAAKVVGEMTGYSKGWVIQKLAEVAQLAASADDFKAANEALKLIGEEFGMFKGASGLDDSNEGGAKALDLGALTALMDQNPGAAGPMLNVTPDKDEPLDAATLSLIEGQGARRKANRKLSTGSETDVALKPESEPEDEFEGEAVAADSFTRIDPKTSPEDIIAMVHGEKTLSEQIAEDDYVEGQEVFDAAAQRMEERHPPISTDPIDDDAPPRRSRTRNQ